MQVSSITSSVFDYEYENGRRYHGYKAGFYPLPNDEKELDRLDLQHHVFTLCLGGELYLAPIKRPKRVLDLGTGTGLWAILMADKHPEANVLGVDLSPVQPDMVPENAHFEIDDIEADWLYGHNYFDFIHSRVMIGAVSDWQRLLRQSFEHLKPGGYLELQELDPRVLSDDGTHRLSPFNCQFGEQIVKASELYGRPVPHFSQLKAMMEEAGFVDVEARYFKQPYNTWARDPRLKEIGKYQLINYYEGYEAIGIGLFTRALGWTDSEFQVFLARIRNELRDRRIHTYNTFTVVYGRKPPISSSDLSRHTSPASATSSVGEPLSTSNAPRRILPPVPLFNDPPKPAPVELPPDIMVAAQTKLPDSPPTTNVPLPERPSYPGKLTFRINRRGEVIRMRESDDPIDTVTERDTVYSFTVNTGQLSLTDNEAKADARSTSSKKSAKKAEVAPTKSAQQEKLERLRRAQEEEAADPEFQPGLKPGQLPKSCLAPGMTSRGGLHFTKETYAKILAK